MNTVTLMPVSLARASGDRARSFRASARGEPGMGGAGDASTTVEASPDIARYTRGMFSRHRLAEVAALLGDPGRAGMVTALWDGTARPAGELARIAGVTPATASSHLSRLVAGGVLRVEPRGRHRYYRLAGAHVARALEALALLVTPHVSNEGQMSSVSPLRRAPLRYDPP